MAKALWNQEITKSTDWAGDASTRNAPVSGQYVQKFIKDTLNKKFGYLHYNKTASKYYVFADEDDYKLWEADKVKNGSLLLASFDAPAPAVIEIRNFDDPSVPNVDGTDRTIIKGEANQYIRFNYKITDSNKNPISEAVVMRILFTANGSTETYSQTIPANPRLADTGTPVEFKFDKYIENPGDYTITVTLTGATTQATTSIIFMCTVIDLSFNLSFDNLKPIDSDKQWFNIGYSLSGAKGYPKFAEILIDGEKLYQDGLGWGNTISTDTALTSDAQKNESFSLFLLDSDGFTTKWPSAEDEYKWNGRNDVLENKSLAGKAIFAPGKHSLQMRIYIMLGTTQVYSETKYYEFVIKDESISDDTTYLLYSTSLAPGKTFTAGAHIEAEVEQYENATFTTSVINIGGRKVNLDYDIYKVVDSELQEYDSLTAEVETGESNTLNYTFRDSGSILIKISAASSEDEINIDVTVNKSDADVAETTGAIYKYYALNKQNSSNRGVWKNESGNTQYVGDATFNENVLFVDGQDGWTGNSLRFKNGGTMTVPFNIFAPKDIAGETYDLADYGLTFEIEFTTSNVLSDTARILDYYDANNRSYIKITTTSAEIKSQQGATIKTNFKENERIKLAFIINPIRNIDDEFKVTEEAARGIKYPNTLMIMVNGVLDRACRWGNGKEDSTKDTFAWKNNAGGSFVVGDIDNAATVDISSIRLYNRSLELDDEFKNYMYDSTGTELLDIFRKNNILASDGTPVFELVKNMIPTMVIGIDYRGADGLTGINAGTDKKDNYSAEVQYYDLNDPNLNFYARNVWISCQGTSSMKYPTKNLRLYFGKTPDKKSKSTIVSLYDDNAAEPIGNAPDFMTKAEYETEFFPYSVYNGHENTMSSYADEILPYSINKKVDGPDGVAPYSGNGNVGVVHEGYHKVGSNLTASSKIELVRKYITIDDPYFVKDKNSGTFVDRSHKPEFYIIDSSVEPKYVKNAFDKVYKLYASNGFDGYLSEDNGLTWSEEFYTGDDAISVDCFKLIHIDANENIEELGETLSSYIEEGNDLYISAYRPLSNPIQSFDANGKSAALLQYERELRYSGAKFYKREETYDPENPNKLIGVKYSEVKKKKALDDSTFYYSLGTYWRQYNESGHVSGWTDRWTIKADFAESSMTHNSGIGRLWTEALKAVSRTNAQNVANIDKYIDIRTGCDGKPIAMFYKQLRGYNETTGKPIYGPTTFAGLFNIMTDKSSTKLFGFEDIYNERGEKTFGASNVQCWECLSNGSGLPTGISLAFDNGVTPNVNDKGSLGEDRLIFKAYEARFPDSGQERHEFNPAENASDAEKLGNNWPDDTYGVETNKLESFLRWLNFCAPAIKYTIGEGNQTIDGYNGGVYNKIAAFDEVDLAHPEAPQNEKTALFYYVKYNNAKNLIAAYEQAGNTSPEAQIAIKAAEEDMLKYNIYIKWDDSGNDAYAGLGETYKIGGVDQTVEFITDSIDDIRNMANYEWYSWASNINYEVVSKTINDEVIPTDIYCVPMKGFDAKYRCIGPDGETNEEESAKYMVDVYLTPIGGNQLKYIDETGTERTTSFTALGISQDDYLKVEGKSWKGRKYMDFFKATWREHLDPDKVAAYFIYLTRFGAVDQVVKNSMMTTENGEQWYFINYDNDTTLGVRNDGHLVYNWDIDRNTFDNEIKSYAYAGSKSVLWNTLELCDDFMDLVREKDRMLFENRYLSANAVLTWLNEKQEHVWCERLYNAQEDIKYMSTFTQNFTLTNYLAFMQGTRESHRTWWVNKRWELYDSKWNTGLFEKQQIHVFFGVGANANSRQPLAMITAASDYTFSLWANSQPLEDGWKAFIKKNENYMFEVPKGEGLAIGDPARIFGPQKIKVLNLRLIACNNGGSVGAENNMVATESGINWVRESGSLITKLLIGSNDSSKRNGATQLNGLNQVYSMEEIDIRYCAQFSSILINGLNNLHRFRATGTALTAFEPALGATIYELSLPETLESLILNDVTFKKNTAEYVVYQDENSEVIRWNPDTKQTYQTKLKDIMPVDYQNIVDKLPQYLLDSSYKYCKTYVEDENGVPSLEQTEKDINNGYVFDYTPNANLTQIVLNNVVGLDTYQFLNDWYDSLVEASSGAFEDVTDDEGNFLYTKCTYEVTLTGINWVLYNDENLSDGGKTAAEKLVEMHRKFTWAKDSTGKELFTGNIYLADFDENSYDLLVEEFGENVFTSTNQVVVSAPAQIFFNVKTPDVELVELEDYSYYNVVGGTKLEVKADIFPVSDTIDYVYVLKLSGKAPGKVGNQSPSMPYTLTKSTKNKEEFSLMNNDGTETGLKLTNVNGYATLIADPNYTYWSDLVYGANSLFEINVYGYNEDGSINYTKSKLAEFNVSPIYVRFIRQILPSNITMKLADNDTIENMPSSFTDDEPHRIKVDLGSSYNVNVKSITVSFSQHGYPVSHSYRNGYGEEIATISKENNLTEFFTLDYSLGGFNGNPQLPIYLTVEMDDEAHTKFERTISINITCIPATDMGLRLDETNYWDGRSLLINDIKQFDYEVIYDPAEPNIQYVVTAEVSDLPSGVKMTSENGHIIIDPTEACRNRKEVYGNGTLYVTATPVNTGIESLSVTYPIGVEIRMPDHIVMGREKLLPGRWDKAENNLVMYNANSSLSANPFNINLTRGEFHDGEVHEGNRYTPYKILFSTKTAQSFDPTVSKVVIKIDDIKIGESIDDLNSPVDPNTISSHLKVGGITFGSGVYTFKSFYDADGDNSNDNTDQLISNVTINGHDYESINGMYLYVGEQGEMTNAINTIVEITCHAEYDNTESDEVDILKSTEQQKLRFQITRSTHVSSTWETLKVYNDSANNGEYILYAVDNKNRFFEFGCSFDDETGEPSQITCKFKSTPFSGSETPYSVTGNVSGNATDLLGDWRGVGFVKRLPDSNVKHPIFISFVQYLKYSLGNDNNIELNSPIIAGNNHLDKIREIFGEHANVEELSAAGTYGNRNDGYTGYQLTKVYAEYDDGNSSNMFHTILNKYNDVELYVPSVTEAHIWLEGKLYPDTNSIVEVPSTELKALNLLVRYLKDNRFIKDVEIHLNGNGIENYVYTDQQGSAEDYINTNPFFTDLYFAEGRFYQYAVTGIGFMTSSAVYSNTIDDASWYRVLLSKTPASAYGKDVYIYGGELPLRALTYEPDSCIIIPYVHVN